MVKKLSRSRKWLKRPLFSTVDRQPTDPGCCLFLANPEFAVIIYATRTNCRIPSIF
jgi:hypothetical protein